MGWSGLVSQAAVFEFGTQENDSNDQLFVNNLRLPSARQKARTADKAHATIDMKAS